MDDRNLVLSPLRHGGGGGSCLESPSSGKSTPRGSPSFRRLSSGRAPRREGKAGGFIFSYCFRSNRIVLWLLLITLLAYAGFYFQSRWAHGDNKEDLFRGGHGGESDGGNSAAQRSNRRDLIAAVDSRALRFKIETSNSTLGVDVVLAKSVSGNKLNENKPSKKRSWSSSRKKGSGKPKKNMTCGFLVGPFGSVEDSILEWSPKKRSGTCDCKGAFARLVWSRKFVLIIHELSMTGAPLAMLELATEFLGCGATISVIVLNKKGGLMPELTRRKIKVLEHKSDLSFKTAMKANLIIAGSAVCPDWIDQYLSCTVLGSTQIMWWIVENRSEYFDLSKKLIFISESQSKQWLDWCDDEKNKLNDEPALVPFSVTDELAFAAGISCSLNTPSFTTENMLEKRLALRSAVRQEMELTDDDMLVISLSSINPGKGQLLLMETTRLVLERGQQQKNSGSRDKILIDHDYYSRPLLQKPEGDSESSCEPELSGKSSSNIDTPTNKRIRLSHIFTDKDKLNSLVFGREARRRRMLSQNVGNKEQNLKILIGSVGSKSNKVAYVKTLVTFLLTHSNLSRSVFWTPATTPVASLYAAADVYVMNSQGIGETFGRVTIVAMAFGLPVLGTDSGGTREIVEHNATDLLHLLGHPGSQVLARNFEFLPENPSARQEMGMRGRAILLLIALWAFAGIYFQSRWAQGDNRGDLFRGVYGGELDGGMSAAQHNNRRDLIDVVDSGGLKFKNEASDSSLKDVDAVLAKSESGNKLNECKPLNQKSRRSPRKKGSGKPNTLSQYVESEVDVLIEEIPEKNSAYGFLVGPYGSVEDSILEWSPEKRSGACDWKGAFARFVWSRKFVLIFHDLSMTGARPLAMLELAMEFLSSGATISVIVLNKREGLMPDLTRRKIKMHEHKSDLSFKTAMKVNLIIAGSAVCSNWIENMLEKRVKGQLLHMESACLMLERGQQQKHPFLRGSILIDHNYYSRVLLQKQNWYSQCSLKIDTPNKTKRMSSYFFTDKGSLNSLVFGSDARVGKSEENRKMLIGLVRSKSNSLAYVKTLLSLLSTNSNLSNSVLWTPSTIRVASLYAAADVYVMNSQLLGTHSGGTGYIAEHATGLGAMGMRRKEKPIFKKFGEVLHKCMRFKL